jgi:hypothetical protein
MASSYECFSFCQHPNQNPSKQPFFNYQHMHCLERVYLFFPNAREGFGRKGCTKDGFHGAVLGEKSKPGHSLFRV